MQIWILTSVEKLYIASKEVLVKNEAKFYIELGDSDGNILQIQILDNNEKEISHLIMKGIHNFTYHNFVILQNCVIDLHESIYRQPNLNEYIINGRGGKETEEEIECIYLNVFLKKPNIITKSLFNKIINNLKKNSYFIQGFSNASAMHKKALYDTRVVNKTKKYNLDNPLSLIKIINSTNVFI